MNDLTIVEKAQDLMERAYALSMGGEVWKVEPLGHTELQINRFVLNNKDFPTDDSKYRQCILELWSRWGAWRQAKYQHDKLGAQVEIWRAEQDELREKTGMSASGHHKTEAQIGLLEVEINNATTQQGELKIDMEYRIIRETGILLDALAKLSPAEGNRMEVELKNWQERAKNNDKVKKLLEA
jgi:flagellar biosynthesis chaperone FliJ